MEKLKISLGEISSITGESLPVIYDAIKAGHLKTFLVGRRRFGRPKDAADWVDFLEAESVAGRPVSYRARGKERAPSTDSASEEYPGTGRGSRR